MSTPQFTTGGGKDTTSTISISESRISEMLSAGQVEDALLEILSHGITPSSVHARQMKAMMYMRKREFDKAKAIVMDLVKRSQDPLSIKMMGDISFLTVKYEDAEHWYKKALEKMPGNPDVTHDLGVSIVSQGRLEEAIRIFRKSCELNPNHASFRHHLSMMLLLNGQYREGWTLMESRLEVPGICGGFPNPEKYWRGQDVNGKTIVLRSEQGFGDTIMFMRYARKFLDRGAKKIYFYGQPAMCSFVEHYYPYVRSIPNVAPPPLDFDYHVSIMSFGLRFLGDYMTAPAIQDSERDGIGVCWFGSPTHQADHLRTVQVDRFVKLRDAFPNENWVVAAYGRFDAGPPPGFQYRIDGCRDWLETAQIVKKLKLIITVDTAIAHLGGFLGVPVWLMLPYVTDFRWGFKQTETTPWYESVKLYRQNKLFDWDTPFARVEEDLGKFLGQRSPIKAEAA